MPVVPTTPWPELPHARLLAEAGTSSPVIIAAFEGWNDAGDAATTAARYLINRWSARPSIDLDPEPFFDFASTRPLVVLEDDGSRRIAWPETRFFAPRTLGHDGAPDAVVLLGIEPQMRWRTFCEHIVGVAKQLDARMIVTLGALLAEVPHTRPTRVYGTVDTPELVGDMDLEASSYEGPTGIVGVLGALARDNGLGSASLWAAVPSYVPGAPSPKAALALIERLGVLMRTSISTVDLQLATAAYERQVTELVAEDDDTITYVRSLEEQHDDDNMLPTADSLVAEVERFLRDQEA